MDIKLVIRPADFNDAQAMHRMRLQPKVMSGITSTPDERLAKMANYLKNADSNTRILVAEHDDQVVGSISMALGRGRRRHIGYLGMIVDENYHGQGIGSRLLTEMLNIADNYFNLVRVELEVLADNNRAIAFYQRNGFVSEGLQKYALIKDGAYADIIIMAHYNEKLLPGGATS